MYHSTGTERNILKVDRQVNFLTEALNFLRETLLPFLFFPPFPPPFPAPPRSHFPSLELVQLYVCNSVSLGL